MSNTNSTIKVEWYDKVTEVRAQWENNHFISDGGLAGRIYFSDEFNQEWSAGEPKYSVLHDDGQTSVVEFDEECEEFVSVQSHLPIIYYNKEK